MSYLKKIILYAVVLIVAGMPMRVVAQTPVGGNTMYDIDYLTPKQYEIGGITFEGADNFDTRMVLLIAGINVGDKIVIPGDKISTAIDNLWKQGLFEDVQIAVTRIQGSTAFLKITLRERPKLTVYILRGIKGDDQKRVREDLHLTIGDVVTENLLTTSSNIIRSYFFEKGYTNCTVNATMIPDTANGKQNMVKVDFDIKVGKRVKIDSLIFVGNDKVPTKKLIRKMKKTHDVHYAKKLYFWTGGFWKRSKYREADYNEDIAAVIDYYNELGYRDARVVKDTVYLVPTDQLHLNNRKKARQDRLKIKIDVFEGQQYYFRNITFSGNTIYSSDMLSKHLRINKGDPYNKTVLETNLTYNPSGTDITSLYMDNGYLFFRATPVEVAVDNDSIDIEIRIVEGKQARVRNVIVEGNTLTNDEVIYRELYTRPGDMFSRDAVLRSRRELITLGYFKEESLIPEPKPNAEDGTVDIVYHVEEGNSSQIQLQGGYGGGMFLGTMGLQLNNFSMRNIFDWKSWNPFPAGDGQKLNVSMTFAQYYYSIGLGFTEPWLGGHIPQALSVNAYRTSYNTQTFNGSSGYILSITGATISLGRRLKWPDDYFSLSQALYYKHYNLTNCGALSSLSLLGFTDGYANEFAYGITLSRNSYDSPVYTRNGSEISLSGSLTPPYSLISGKDYSNATAQELYRWIEYYKVNLRGSWFMNLFGDVVLNARFRMGYMGYYNNQIGLSPFGRYFLGGDGLASYVLDGREVIPMRGYGDGDLSPQAGASVFDRFTLELHQPILESNSTTIWVLGFLEGGNSWSHIRDFNPFSLYNSAGVGLRLYMPGALGLIGLDWGYGFDGTNGGSHFHFSINQSID